MNRNYGEYLPYEMLNTHDVALISADEADVLSGMAIDAGYIIKDGHWLNKGWIRLTTGRIVCRHDFSFRLYTPKGDN